MYSPRMDTPESFSALIDRWPTIVAFSTDLDVPYQTAAAMKRRDSIDPEYWELVISKAGERGINGVTWEYMAKLAAGVRDARAS